MVALDPTQIPEKAQFVLPPRPKIELFDDAQEKPSRRRREREITRPKCAFERGANARRLTAISKTGSLLMTHPDVAKEWLPL